MRHIFHLLFCIEVTAFTFAFSHELEKVGPAENLTKEQAREIILKCVRVCYLRDCKAMNKYYISTINSEGAEVEGPLLIDSNWESARGIQGYN